MEICSCTGCTKYITLQMYAKNFFYSKSIKSKGNIFFFQFKHNSERLSGWKRCIHTSTLLDRCWRSGRSIKGPKLDELLYQLVKIIMEKQIIRWDVEICLVSEDDIKSTYHYNSTLLSQSSFSDCIKEILVLWTNVTKNNDRASDCQPSDLFPGMLGPQTSKFNSNLTSRNYDGIYMYFGICWALELIYMKSIKSILSTSISLLMFWQVRFY